MYIEVIEFGVLMEVWKEVTFKNILTSYQLTNIYVTFISNKVESLGFI
jgi:hypothetical protein